MQFLLFTPSDYRLQEGRGVKRMIRKWIRLSPFPLSHQPGKEIQRGNLKEEKEETKTKPNGGGPRRDTDREKIKQATNTDAGSRNATFDTNVNVRSLRGRCFWKPLHLEPDGVEFKSWIIIGCFKQLKTTTGTRRLFFLKGNVLLSVLKTTVG